MLNTNLKQFYGVMNECLQDQEGDTSYANKQTKDKLKVAFNKLDEDEQDLIYALVSPMIIESL